MALLVKRPLTKEREMFYILGKNCKSMLMEFFLVRNKTFNCDIFFSFIFYHGNI